MITGQETDCQWYPRGNYCRLECGPTSQGQEVIIIIIVIIKFITYYYYYNSLFDQLEDSDADACIKKSVELSK